MRLEINSLMDCQTGKPAFFTHWLIQGFLANVWNRDVPQAYYWKNRPRKMKQKWLCSDATWLWHNDTNTKDWGGQQDAWFYLDLPERDIYNKNQEMCLPLNVQEINTSGLVNQLARSSGWLKPASIDTCNPKEQQTHPGSKRLQICYCVF